MVTRNYIYVSNSPAGKVNYLIIAEEASTFTNTLTDWDGSVDVTNKDPIRAVISYDSQVYILTTKTIESFADTHPTNQQPPPATATLESNLVDGQDPMDMVPSDSGSRLYITCQGTNLFSNYKIIGKSFEYSFTRSEVGTTESVIYQSLKIIKGLNYVIFITTPDLATLPSSTLWFGGGNSPDHSIEKVSYRLPQYGVTGVITSAFPRDNDNPPQFEILFSGIKKALRIRHSPSSLEEQSGTATQPAAAVMLLTQPQAVTPALLATTNLQRQSGT